MPSSARGPSTAGPHRNFKATVEGATASATSAQRLGGLTQSATGAEVFSGTAAQKLGGLVQSATGGEVFSSTIAQRVAGLRQSAIGSEVFAATIAQRLSGLRQAATGAEVFSATCVQHVGGFAQTSTGAEVFSGTCTQRVGPLRQTATGAEVFAGPVVARIRGVTQTVTGLFVGAVDFAAQRMGAFTQAATGGITRTNAYAGAPIAVGPPRLALPLQRYELVYVSHACAQTVGGFGQAAQGDVSAETIARDVSPNVEPMPNDRETLPAIASSAMMVGGLTQAARATHIQPAVAAAASTVGSFGASAEGEAFPATARDVARIDRALFICCRERERLAWRGRRCA